jgi:hypothetical protein
MVAGSSVREQFARIPVPVAKVKAYIGERQKRKMVVLWNLKKKGAEGIP